MATAFQSLNINLGPRDHKSEATTPTTPIAPFDSPARHQQHAPPHEETGLTTPTRQTFAESNGKRALPTSPLDSSFQPSTHSPKREEQRSLVREDSQPSTNSTEDVDMDNSDDEDDGSDGESVDDENGRPSKKKKGQRFFCTDYPPCNLSFTRSEHLARHIRKHTGERPFQCHCARRFSRLDNLRQHAQTVHVNEDIPGDSLAATGTRFQRQIRTDRVRPQSGRSRASTAGSSGSHGHRGHSRNLSTSSITSTSSTISTMSNMSSISRDNSQRRPPPLMMADQSPRARLTIDTMKASPQPPYGFGNSEPSGATTPTSVVYSNGPGSPFGSSLGSPMTSRRQSGYWGGDHAAPGRRLSVPSGANPFQAASGTGPGPQYYNHFASPNASHDSSNTSSMVTSPTSSVHSFNRQDSSAAEADLRRRTWHPSTYSNYSYQQRPATSGLIFQQTPDAPRPAFAPQPPPAATQPQRLPGFETFDQISQRPETPPRHPDHQLETYNRPALYSGSSDRNIRGPGHRRGHASWDLSLHQNLTKLDIANGTPPRETTAWGKQVAQVMEDIRNLENPSSRPSSFGPPLSQPSVSLQEAAPKRPAESGHYPQARPATPQRHPKHTAYYNATPIALNQIRPALRTSPDGSSSSEGVTTPSTTSADYNPSIIHANGYIESQSSPGPSFQNYSSTSSQRPPSFASQASEPLRQVPISKQPDMSGLEALVAVATSEEKSR